MTVASLTYVYAVTRADAPVPTGVELVEHGELAAVTRPVERRDLRARRRDLLEHAEIVQTVFEQTTVVPLQFGAVFDDVVAELLEPRHDELASLLRELDGLVELTVSATYREDDVLRAMLDEQPALRRLRERATPLELGEAVARTLAARRDADANQVVQTLGRHARTSALDNRRTELEVFRGAFLVERRKVKSFDAEAERLAKEHASTTSFTVTGPLAPHHFVSFGGARR